jgi:hypothetical protein
MNLTKLPERHPFDRRKFAAMAMPEHLLGFFIPKRTDHRYRIS